MANYAKAQELARGCKTCKELENLYKGLMELGFEKDSAKNFIRTKKEEMKTAKDGNKAEKDFIRGWFADFEKVGKSLLIGICKEDGIKFAEISDKFESVESFVNEYTTKADSFGKPIRKTKKGWEYRTISANNIRVLLRECISNFNSEKNGFKPNYIRVEISEIVTE